MKNLPQNLLICIFFLFLWLPMTATGSHTPTVSKPPTSGLENPMSVQYLQKHLQKQSPRLVLNPQIEKQLKQKLKTDRVVQNMYDAIRLNADAIQKEPLLERKMNGRRLLAVSREMLYRMNMLGMVYRMEQDPAVLEKINKEVVAVCNFSDWNPSHFLDVAEMALAVAIAIDWAGDDLPASTVSLAQTALIEKAIMPSYETEHEVVWWINTTNNWNQVCHGGLIAAAIVTAEKNPELAAKTIHRALENMHLALEEYAPDGVYPEGATYWGYGTSFTVITAAMLESAFGTDFGIAAFPSFKESADFKLLCIAPSGLYYNFGDSGNKRGEKGDLTLAWFATATGNGRYFEKERFLMPPADMGKLSRLDGAGLVWLAQFEEKHRSELPLAWKGDGNNPIVFFWGGEEDPHQYYFGAKGGGGTINHGNMDGGSFVFELNGVRWSIDPGNQSYTALEEAGFNLWSNCQECDRWKLLTKNNFGHSTLSVNDQLHIADGLATIKNFKDGVQAEVTIDITPSLKGQLKTAERRFVKDSPNSLVIEDYIEPHEATQAITWQMMTTAAVEIIDGGAKLTQQGRVLELQNLSHPQISVTVVDLNPPPIELDVEIPGLKRIEIKIPAKSFNEKNGPLKVRLQGAD